MPKKPILKNSIKYYSIRDKLLKQNADINIVFGQRSQGKTYSCIDYALERYANYKETFCYIRRWDTDIKQKDMEKLFAENDLTQYFGNGFYITYWRGCFTLCKDEVDSKGNTKKLKFGTLGWALSLNVTHHTKGQRFPDCTSIIFDEFLPMQNERLIYKEVECYEQTISTIARTRQNLKIFLLGNTITQRSPYFTLYGIDIRKLQQGEITTLILENEGVTTKICIEWCEHSEEIGKITSKYVLGSKMARTGEWELADISQLPYTDGEQSSEKLLFTMFDPDMNTNIGVFVRSAEWFTKVSDGGILSSVRNLREFLVIRETTKTSNYFHLTTIKDLKYNTYMDIDLMLADIVIETGFDLMKELNFGRVYAANPFIADYFLGCLTKYQLMKIGDKL